MKLLKFFVPSIIAISTLSISTCSFSLPVMDMRIEKFMMQEGDLKKTLNLNSNQQILWEQIVSKSVAIVRERHSRRQRLQLIMTKDLKEPKAELRDLATQIDAESDASIVEDKKLRGLWLTVNDALDEKQRGMIIEFLADQLQRVEGGSDRGPGRKNEGEGDSGLRNRSGGRRGAGGSMSGGMEGNPSHF